MMAHRFLILKVPADTTGIISTELKSLAILEHAYHNKKTVRLEVSPDYHK